MCNTRGGVFGLLRLGGEVVGLLYVHCLSRVDAAIVVAAIPKYCYPLLCCPVTCGREQLEAVRLRTPPISVHHNAIDGRSQKSFQVMPPIGIVIHVPNVLPYRIELRVISWDSQENGGPVSFGKPTVS